MGAKDKQERTAWRHLCDVFEQLTGESMDDAASPKEYKAFASLCKIWAEHLTSWISAQEATEPELLVPASVSARRLEERDAWSKADAFLDKIAREQWTDDRRTLKIVEPDTGKYLAVIAAVGDWGTAMYDVRIAQGEDRVRWGRNVIQFESAKIKKFKC